MNDLPVTSSTESITNRYAVSENQQQQNENLPQRSIEDTQKLIPRNQNKMVAETTHDMFMSGLMCE